MFPIKVSFQCQTISYDHLSSHGSGSGGEADSGASFREANQITEEAKISQYGSIILSN